MIDVLVGYGASGSRLVAPEPLEEIGYACWDEEPNPRRRYFFGFTNADRTKRPRKLRVVETKDELGEARPLFRDYPRTHPEAARKHARLERGLAAPLQDDCEACTAAKARCVKDVEERAGGLGSGARSL